MMHLASRTTLMAALLLLSLFSLVVASMAGSHSMGIAEWWSALLEPESAAGELLWRLRLPRAAAAWVVGATLAISGCLMQVLLRNPLADPYILGVSGGAACAALLGMTLGIATVFIPALAMLGALLSILIVFALARGSGPWSGTRLLLTGVVTAAGWAAVISLILATGPDNSLRGMLFWLMGDFSYARLPAWAALVLLAGLFLTLGMARSLNILSMGETTARLLGENSRALMWFIYLLASVLTAAAVSVAGTIGFVGLIVPHLVRLVTGSDHRILIPASTLFGGSFLVLSDTLARTALAPRQLPVGVVTALLGVPLFLVLLNRARIKGPEA